MIATFLDLGHGLVHARARALALDLARRLVEVSSLTSMIITTQILIFQIRLSVFYVVMHYKFPCLPGKKRRAVRLESDDEGGEREGGEGEGARPEGEGEENAQAKPADDSSDDEGPVGNTR